jgi:hypothetical protein
MNKNIWILSTLLVTTLFWSCKKDDSGPSTSNYPVPATYNFSNVNDSNEMKLLLMADQIVAAINLGNSAGVAVSAQQLKDMFNNVNGYFTDSSFRLNGSGLKLADYCPAAAKTDMLNYFDSIGLYSLSNAAAAPGIAGVNSSSANPSKKYLFSPNGVFYSQVVKKTIMGICAYQIVNAYMSDSVKGMVENTTIVPGTGTTLEHLWDEAFGFFGAPVDFPTNISGLKYFGSYSNQVDPGLHSNATLMNAFIKGRAAISYQDMTTMQQQAAIIVTTFDELEAATIVQEMKETDENIDAGDAVAAYGTLSEAVGFVHCLKYNTNAGRKITNAQIAQLEALFDSAHPESPDLYAFVGANVNTAEEIKGKTDAIRQFIGNVYGFSASVLANL